MPKWEVPHILDRHYAEQHDADRYVKKMTYKEQLTILLYAQATGKDSLREIETGLLLQDSSMVSARPPVCSTLNHGQSQ